MSPDESEATIGEATGAVCRSMMRLGEKLEEKGTFTEDEVDEMMEPIQEFINRIDLDE